MMDFIDWYELLVILFAIGVILSFKKNTRYEREVKKNPTFHLISILVLTLLFATEFMLDGFDGWSNSAFVLLMLALSMRTYYFYLKYKK